MVSAAAARVQAAALNVQDLDTFVNQMTRHARVVRDGRLLGEGRQAVRKGMAAEHGDAGSARLALLDGEHVIAEFHGDPEKPRLDGVIRFHQIGDFVDEVRIDHDPELLRRLTAA